MYLDDDDEVEGLLDVGYTFTVWNVYQSAELQII